MAATTLKAIVDRFQAVLEASPLSLKATRDAFSHDRQPNALLDGTYYIQDDGVAESRPVSNHADVRIDRLTVFLARKLAFDGQTQKETIETTLNTIERYLIADGPANSYHAFIGGRRVTRPAGTDIAIGSITVHVDYDFSTSTS